MNKTNFTPGPWRVGFDDGSGCVSKTEGAWILRDDPDVGAMSAPEIVAGGSDGIPYGVLRMEDAHLIAAAPEMYEAGDEALAALYGAREVLGDVANISHAINMLESAARKARGEK